MSNSADPPTPAARATPLSPRSWALSENRHSARRPFPLVQREDRFDEFIAPLQTILRQHNINVINVSIRQVNRDPGSLLAWARTEVFAFVFYYKQGMSDTAREEVALWTRELIDGAL